jgi:hypothetical protein
MVEMVHGRIAAGESTVVSKPAVLRCGKQMEKLQHQYFPDNLFPKIGVMWEVLLLENNLKEAKRYWKLKEEAQDPTLWRTQLERGYGLVARQTTT